MQRTSGKQVGGLIRPQKSGLQNPSIPEISGEAISRSAGVDRKKPSLVTRVSSPEVQKDQNSTAQCEAWQQAHAAQHPLPLRPEASSWRRPERRGPDEFDRFDDKVMLEPGKLGDIGRLLGPSHIGWRRMVPVDEQGASRSTQSNSSSACSQRHCRHEFPHPNRAGPNWTEGGEGVTQRRPPPSLAHRHGRSALCLAARCRPRAEIDGALAMQRAQKPGGKRCGNVLHPPRPSAKPGSKGDGAIGPRHTDSTIGQNKAAKFFCHSPGSDFTVKSTGAST